MGGLVLLQSHHTDTHIYRAEMRELYTAVAKATHSNHADSSATLLACRQVFLS
jgi:hypothetical protein